jgi:hypothetical protein
MGLFARSADDRPVSMSPRPHHLRKSLEGEGPCSGSGREKAACLLMISAPRRLALIWLNGRSTRVDNLTKDQASRGFSAIIETVRAGHQRRFPTGVGSKKALSPLRPQRNTARQHARANSRFQRNSFGSLAMLAEIRRACGRSKASLLRAGARTMAAKLRVVINAGSQSLLHDSCG